MAIPISLQSSFFVSHRSQQNQYKSVTWKLVLTSQGKPLLVLNMNLECFCGKNSSHPKVFMELLVTIEVGCMKHAQSKSIMHHPRLG